MVVVERAGRGDAEAALDVWRSANIARGRPPSVARTARVREKLIEPDRTLLVARTEGRVVAMALLEPGRDDEGTGAPVPGLGHIAMVFVEPSAQRGGVGGAVLAALAQAAEHAGVTRLIVWTGVDNEPAGRLYRGAGFSPTGLVHEKGDLTITQFVLDARRTRDFVPDQDAMVRVRRMRHPTDHTSPTSS